MVALGTVTVIRRYPVKSMLGEELSAADLTTSGVQGDRAFALIDIEDGRVASAKRPSFWRKLLQCRAAWVDGSVSITLADGSELTNRDPGIDRALAEMLGRPVRLSDARPAGATLARPAPEDVLEHGDRADVPFELVQIGQGTPGTTFVDYAPVHLITTTTLGQLGAEYVRYRPNLVVETPEGQPFAENGWVGREIVAGSVRLRGILPTPRCAIPTLEHGDLPRAPHAVRTLLAQNRVDVPGFGVLPCAGLYAEVLEGGTVRGGDPVWLA
ncbi:MAG: MOSC domain-containing protein [Acidimicrobiales bacterium]